MVVEGLRTKKIYNIMTKIDFSESLLKQYAENVRAELEEEQEEQHSALLQKD